VKTTKLSLGSSALLAKKLRQAGAGEFIESVYALREIFLFVKPLHYSGMVLGKGYKRRFFLTFNLRALAIIGFALFLPPKICSQYQCPKVNTYFNQALERSVVSYMDSTFNIKQNRCFALIYAVKIVDIDNTKGSFSISEIRHKELLREMNPSYYTIICGKWVVVNTDNAMRDFIMNTRLLELDKGTLKFLIASEFDNKCTTTGQPPPVMVIHYKKGKFKGEYYRESLKVDKKYDYDNNIR
jgi:hypothetical protein